MGRQGLSGPGVSSRACGHLQPGGKADAGSRQRTSQRKGLWGRILPPLGVTLDKHCLPLPLGTCSTGSVSGPQRASARRTTGPEIPCPRGAASAQSYYVRANPVPEEVGLDQRDQDWFGGSWRSVIWGVSPPLSLNPKGQTETRACSSAFPAKSTAVQRSCCPGDRELLDQTNEPPEKCSLGQRRINIYHLKWDDWKRLAKNKLGKNT